MARDRVSRRGSGWKKGDVLGVLGVGVSIPGAVVVVVVVRCAAGR